MIKNKNMIVVSKVYTGYLMKTKNPFHLNLKIKNCRNKLKY